MNKLIYYKVEKQLAATTVMFLCKIYFNLQCTVKTAATIVDIQQQLKATEVNRISKINV